MSANLYQALALALRQEKSSGIQAMSVTHTPATPIVLLNTFPITLDPNDYADPYSTANPKGDLRSLWRFRQLVDPLPQFAQFYIPSSSSTESTYRQIVQGATVDGDNPFASSVLSNAKKTLQYVSFSNMDGTPGTWNPVYASPDEWYDTSQLDHYNEYTLDLNGGMEASNGGQGRPLQWQIGNDMEPPGLRPLDTGSKIHSAKVKCLMVNITRPWFDGLLFATSGWYLSGQQEGFCSSGQNDGGGVMPLIPTSLILGAGATIDAEWSTKDKQILDAARSGQKPLSLGPLQVLAGTSNSSIQVIGWMMSLLPFSPQISKEKAGRILVRNTGGFTGRFSIQYEQSGRAASVESGSFPALSAKDLTIPADATDICVKVEVMTFPMPETWATIVTYNFDKPPVKCYELSGTTIKPQVIETQCTG